jgi:hypothetical protein
MCVHEKAKWMLKVGFFKGSVHFCAGKILVSKEYHMTLPGITIGSTKKIQTVSYSKKIKGCCFENGA